MESIKGTVVQVIFRNDDNGYTVAEFHTDDEELNVTGVMASCQEGMRLRLSGEYINHSRYGRQFKFTNYEELPLENEEQILDFLLGGGISRVGEKTALLLVKKFGNDTLRIIEEEPVRLTEISGIGEKTAESIHNSYLEKIEFSKVAFELGEMGINSAKSLKLYKNYGTGAVELIRNNPYMLIGELSSVSFKEADRLALSIGIEEDNPNRLESGILYIMRRNLSQGSTYVEKGIVIDEGRELLGISGEVIEDKIITMCYDGILVMEEVEGIQGIYLRDYYTWECNITSNLIELFSKDAAGLTEKPENLIDWCCEHMNIQLSENQRKAVFYSITEPMSIITGGPGTGKTTILHCIATVLKEEGIKAFICAPTGRAAKRVEEATGYKASTIHKLLEYAYDEINDMMYFGKNREERLDCGAVIVDEASMIDLQLMKALTDAMKPGTRLILVGDSDQLPPVGSGQVLRDLIECERISVVELTDIYRQSQESFIVTNAHRINRGELPELKGEENRDFFFMERNSIEGISELISQLVSRRLIEHYRPTNPLSDIQVLTPKRKGDLGSVELNKMLQVFLNPQSETKSQIKFGDKIFRMGDKVMQIKNNYRMSWEMTKGYEFGKGIFNGDMGYISWIDESEKKIGVIFDDGKSAVYEHEDLEQLEHAYAITVHKSQGSEFPIVVMPIGSLPKVLCNRNLLYTGVTRAKKLVVLVGSKVWLNKMVEEKISNKRNTGLKSRIISSFDMLEFQK